MTGSPVLALDGVDLAFRHGGELVVALRGVSITISPGELVVVSGPSGSGKSSLLSTVAGLESPTAGSIRLASRSGSGGRVRYVAQSLALVSELSVAENVFLPLRVAEGTATNDRGQDLIDRLGLRPLADRYPDEISVGEQQRTAVARAVLLRPDLLAADEPTAHQDQKWADVLVGLLRDEVARGSAALVASHDPDVIAAATRHFVLEYGRLRAA